MKAAIIQQFGPISVIVIEDLPRPEPAFGELLIRVKVAGVGPWDALVREGKSGLGQLPPLILGSDLSGVVETVGPGVLGFEKGEEVYGVTNLQFTGAYAEFALASAALMAKKPAALNYFEAASVPVIAVTAWQLLFDYAHASTGQSVLILGAAGNVGAYAVQFAKQAGLSMVATCAARDADYVARLGARKILDYSAPGFDEALAPVDIVVDTVGGSAQENSLRHLKPGGILVSSVSPVPDEKQRHYGIRAAFFLMKVTTARLNALAELFDSGKLVTQVGSVLPLADARAAHQMLAGAPHKRGKIVLNVAV